MLVLILLRVIFTHDPYITSKELLELIRKSGLPSNNKLKLSLMGKAGHLLMEYVGHFVIEKVGHLDMEKFGYRLFVKIIHLLI